MSNAFPVTVKEATYKFLFGLVKVWWLMEDRRPDLSDDQKEAGQHYKYQLTITILWKKKLSWVFHSGYSYDDQPFIN